MKLDEWSVVSYNTPNETKRTIVYGDIDEFVEENNINTAGMKLIPKEEWTLNEMIEITGNLLEDINHHKTESKPRFIVETMRKANIQEFQIKAFMMMYMTDLFNHYGY